MNSTTTSATTHAASLNDRTGGYVRSSLAMVPCAELPAAPVAPARQSIFSKVWRSAIDPATAQRDAARYDASRPASSI